MTEQAFRLMPRAPVHFGRDGYELEESVESFPSDSLFAALVAAHVDLFGDPEAFISVWIDEGARLTSIFPCVGDLPLLPMPRVRVKIPEGGGKALKKIRYVSPGIMRALLHGHQLSSHWSLSAEGAGKPAFALQGGAVWIAEDERKLLPEWMRRLSPERLREQQIWCSDTVPRVAVDRITSRSMIYQLGRTTFNEGCGLWCMVEAGSQHDRVLALLEGLGESGMGGERSAGYGAFTLHDDLPMPDLPPASGARRVMTLARYFPLSGEIEAGVLGEQSAYELVTVGGWMASPFSPAQRRKTIRMIEAGSVVMTHDGQPPVGQIVDVRPEYEMVRHPHPVYRSGIAWMVGVPGSAE